MKNWLFRYVVLLPAVIFQSCNMFSAVDPLPPAFSKLELVDIKRTELTVSGTILNPDSKNDRQEKKSGGILEYGLVYGTTSLLDVQKDKVIKIGEKPAQVPISIQNQRVAGLSADTQYYVALYARNEGGGMAYSEVLAVKTTISPAISATRNSVKITNGGGLAFDLDAGNMIASSDPKGDVTMDIFTISGRGTTLSMTGANSLQFKNLGVIDYDKLAYLDLVRINDMSTAGIGYVVNMQTANSVIAFKTGEGRLGKWRIESVSGNVLTISLVTFEK